MPIVNVFSIGTVSGLRCTEIDVRIFIWLIFPFIRKFWSAFHPYLLQVVHYCAVVKWWGNVPYRYLCWWGFFFVSVFLHYDVGVLSLGCTLLCRKTICTVRRDNRAVVVLGNCLRSPPTCCCPSLHCFKTYSSFSGRIDFGNCVLLILHGWDGFLTREHTLHMHTVAVRHVGLSPTKPLSAFRCSPVTIRR